MITVSNCFVAQLLNYFKIKLINQKNFIKNMGCLVDLLKFSGSFGLALDFIGAF